MLLDVKTLYLVNVVVANKVSGASDADRPSSAEQRNQAAGGRR
jgi:hypothetical protein